MATRMSYGAGRMRPAPAPRLPARASVMPLVMIGGLTALLLLLPLTVLTIIQHSARQSAVSAVQDVATSPPAALDVPQAVEEVHVAPAPPAPGPPALEAGSSTMADEQAPFTLVSTPDSQPTTAQQSVEPHSAQEPASPPLPIAPPVQIGVEPDVAPVQQEEQPVAPLSEVSAPAEPAPQVIMPVQPAPPPPVNKAETTSQQSSTQSSPGQSKRRDDHEKGEGAKKDKRN